MPAPNQVFSIHVWSPTGPSQLYSSRRRARPSLRMAMLQQEQEQLQSAPPPLETPDADDDAADEAVEQLFREVDEDGSGELDMDEVKVLCKNLGQKLDNKAISRAFREMDEDKSGAVDLEVNCTCQHDTTHRAARRAPWHAALPWPWRPTICRPFLSTRAGVPLVVADQRHQPGGHLPSVPDPDGARQARQGWPDGAACWGRHAAAAGHGSQQEQEKCGG